jgi:hypothetical protein
MSRAAFIVILTVLTGLVAPPLGADGRFAPVGAPLVVPSWTVNSSVAMDAFANVIVAYTEGRNAYARRFDSNGQPRGEAFLVYAPPPHLMVLNAQVAAGDDGSFVVVWSATTFSPTRHIGFVTYDAGGQRSGEGLIVQSARPSNDLPIVAAAPDGAFIVVWPDIDRVNEALHARVFDAKGGPQTPVFRVDSATSYARDPAVTADGAGRFVVTWMQDGGGLARRFDDTGTPVGDAFPVGYASSLCADGSGLLVTVAPRSTGSGWNYVAQRYDLDGAPVGPEIAVNQTPVPPGPWVSVACARDGAFVAVWPRPDQSGTSDVFARRFTPSGQPDSPEFRVNDTSGGRYYSPVVDSDPAGNFVVLWHVAHETTPHEEGRLFRAVPAPRVKGDFDGDGHPDLVLRRVDDGRVRVWTLHEAARTQNLSVWPPTPDWDWHLGGIDDFNGDGHADLVFRHQVTGAVDIWLLGGAGGVERVGSATFSGASLPPEWIVGATADFDGDRRPDVLWRNRVTGQIRVWLMNGSAWRATVLPDPDLPSDPSWVLIAAGDFDGDGQCDLLWYSTSTGRIVQWLLDASLRRALGRFTTPDTAGGTHWNVVAASDYGFGVLGQAGSTDLVWRDDTTGKFVVWFMDTQGVRTSGTFTAPDAPSDPLGWTVVGPR